MEEYISKEKVKGFVRSGISTDTEADKEYVCSFIDSIPSADVRENIHGHWIATSECDTCSECHFKVVAGFNFCPHCGADMRGE